MHISICRSVDIDYDSESQPMVQNRKIRQQKHVWNASASLQNHKQFSRQCTGNALVDYRSV